MFSQYVSLIHSVSIMLRCVFFLFILFTSYSLISSIFMDYKLYNHMFTARITDIIQYNIHSMQFASINHLLFQRKIIIIRICLLLLNHFRSTHNKKKIPIFFLLWNRITWNMESRRRFLFYNKDFWFQKSSKCKLCCCCQNEINLSRELRCKISLFITLYDMFICRQFIHPFDAFIVNWSKKKKMWRRRNKIHVIPSIHTQSIRSIEMTNSLV